MLVTTTIDPSALLQHGRTLIIHPDEEESPNALFSEICRTEAFRHFRIEQDAEGNISIMAPTGGESSYQNTKITAQLDRWAEQDGQGKSFESNVLYLLPDGSKRSPDASWVSNERLKTISRKERREFLPIVPEFVIELKSPTDSFSRLQMKMQHWISNGVSLGWLIHPDKQTVLVYRKGSSEPQPITMRDDPNTLLPADGPVSGFVLDLKHVWLGLDQL
jgi:Uma2 family endonuclease